MSGFYGRRLPAPPSPAGYAALLERYALRVPPPPRLAFVAERRQRYDGEDVLVLPASHRPADTLAGQLEFALKWEGVDLEVLRAVFRTVPAGELAAVVRAKPVGVYTRRLWFLYEWLTRGGRRSVRWCAALRCWRRWRRSGWTSGRGR